MLSYILVASFSIALLSVLGALFIPQAHTSPVHRFILPFAIGIFLGAIFFELIPETLEASSFWGPFAIMAGFFGFYLLSHFLKTYHHHHHDDHDHCLRSGAKMLLIGDMVHNLADGIVIATAFMVDPGVGILTTLGIALHEVPQEIAEFGVLVRSGYSRRRALMLNFLSASSVILGALLTYLFAESLHEALFILTGIAAGNLLYIAAADMLPELRSSHRDHFAQTFIATIFGTALIAGLITYSHEYHGGHDNHTDEHEPSIHNTALEIRHE